MIRLLRFIGWVMCAAGALVVLFYLIRPLRLLILAMLKLPMPILVGLAAAAVGFLLVLVSLVWERFKERGSDRALLADLPETPRRTEKENSEC
jgi:hypothetical protein